MRRIKCCKCGAGLRLPLVWMFGVESVFRCPKCSTIYKTGYRMGAVIMGLALTVALVAANLLVYIFSSVVLPVAVVLVLPLWWLLGVVMRRAWMLYRCRAAISKGKKMGTASE